jgi:hypothetical protein
MSESVRSRLAGRFGRLLAIGVLGVSGCGGDTEDSATSNTEPTVGTAGDRPTTDQVIEDDVAATTVETTVDEDPPTGPETEGLDSEQVDAAIDIARAYFVAKTDFTGDQFEWTLETAARDQEGRWWARVSASPESDPSMSLEAEQIYVYRDADSSLWLAFDMGTGIEPATDERFPEEVRDQL